jgi:hypothetical protein
MAAMMEPMYVRDGTDLIGFAVIALAVVFAVLGFALIRRITRNPDEPSDDHWRSHRH